MLLLLLCLNCNILRDFCHRVASEAAVGLHLQGFQGEMQPKSTQVNTGDQHKPERKRGCSIKVMFHTQSKNFKRQNCPKMMRGPRLNSKATSTDQKRRQPIF